MEQYELLKAIIYDYQADIVMPMCNVRSRLFMLKSFQRSATEEILLYVKAHDPFDSVGSIEWFIDEMEESAAKYPESSIMFLTYAHTAADILDILKSAI